MTGQRKPTGQRSSADVREIPPIRSPEVFIAEQEGRVEVSTDRSRDDDGNPIVTTHTRPGTLVMYKPSETQGYVPRTVSASAVRMLLGQGWHEFCPDCKGRHIDKSGRESTDPNLCSARDPVAVRLCRVCGKRIFDNQGFQFTGEIDQDDPNIIQDDPVAVASPEERTRASLNLHYWVRHPRQAQMMNLPPLPEALQSMIPKEHQGA